MNTYTLFYYIITKICLQTFMNIIRFREYTYTINRHEYTDIYKNI